MGLSQRAVLVVIVRKYHFFVLFCCGQPAGSPLHIGISVDSWQLFPTYPSEEWHTILQCHFVIAYFFHNEQL